MIKVKGFTLVELMVVIAILAILAAIIVPAINGRLINVPILEVVDSSYEYDTPPVSAAVEKDTNSLRITCIGGNKWVVKPDTVEPLYGENHEFISCGKTGE